MMNPRATFWFRLPSVLKRAWQLNLLVVVGCGVPDTSDGVSEFSHEGLDLFDVHGEILNESPIVGRPSEIELSDSILWVKDAVGDPAIHAINARTGDLLRSLARRGGGPGEFHRGVFGLSVRSTDDPGGVWAFDLTLQRLTLFDVNMPKRADEHTISLSGPRVTRAFWMTSDAIIGVARASTGRFVHFDTVGRMTSVVPGLLLGDSTIPESARGNATISAFQICSHPERGFAVLYFMLGRIEFYDPLGTFQRRAKVPYASDARFVLNEVSRRWRVVYDRTWYLSCTATATHIYAVFSGRSHSAFTLAGAQNGHFVHVFSWDDGALVRVLRLDPAVKAVSITSDGSTLYASSTADAKTYRFDLRPSGLKETEGAGGT